MGNLLPSALRGRSGPGQAVAVWLRGRCQICSRWPIASRQRKATGPVNVLPRQYASLMSDGGFAITQSQVQEIVVPARNAMDLYEPFSCQLARQITEMFARLQPDLRVLHEAMLQIAYSGIGEALQSVLRQIAEINSASGILARQREAMASLAASFQPLPVPTAQDLRAAQAALRENLPETPEQVKRVEQVSETIAADPRQRELIRRVVDTLEQADLSKVPPVVVSALLYWWLCHVLSLPLTGEVTSAQAADYLGVVTVVLTVLFGLWPRS